ncbi:MAG: alpha/beta hydrolase-fold protein [Pseudomonadota bacterium]
MPRSTANSRLISKVFRCILLIAWLLILPTSTFAQAENAAAYVLSDSEVRTIQSEALKRTYKLYVKLPSGYDSQESAASQYPVIYFNDWKYCWITAIGVTIAPFNTDSYEKAILVGIGYAEGEEIKASRSRDYTPTVDSSRRRKTGGARDYLTFLKDEVIPLIERTYRVNPDRRMLSGVSYGGLFGAYALLEEPGLFHDYILTSSSLWHNNKKMFDLEKAVAASGQQLSGRVYFAIGEAEVPSISPGFPDMVGQQAEFAKRLRSRGYRNLEVRDEVMEGGTHMTTYPIGLTRGLRWLLPGDRVYAGG